MKNKNFEQFIEPREFGEFTNFFLKYLNGSASHEEAFTRACNRYRRLFKKIPYENSQVFLSEFYKTHN